MQSGTSLYLAIIVMIVLLAIVLGLTSILLGQMVMVREMGYSVIALSAADAGIEAILVYRDNPASSPVATNCTATSIPLCSLDNNAKYYLEVIDSTHPECNNALNYCITSVGICEGVRRAIEIAY